jgi:mandelate racemase
MPLTAFLGAAPKPIRVYNSNGLGLIEAEAAADEAEQLLAGGFEAVKMRLGRPTLEADLAAVRAVRKRMPDEVKIMADFAGPRAMAAAIAARASDFMMPDLERIGGVTVWQQAAALAAATGIEISSHLFPEASAHLLGATPTAHWLEYVDWANPILAAPLQIVDGRARVAGSHRTGVVWNDEAVARYRLS